MTQPSTEATGLWTQRVGAALNILVEAMRDRTGSGQGIDDAQVPTRKLAGLATRAEALRALAGYAEAYPAADTDAERIACAAALFAGETVNEMLTTALSSPDDFGADVSELVGALGSVEEAWAFVRESLAEERCRDLGAALLASGPENNRWIWSETGVGEDEAELRATTRKFARDVIAPEAERIHREDLLVPEHFISKMAEMGYFGMSVPEEYGGVGMTNLMMILATEELSTASLSAAGSLITRPEILSKALLKGGTGDQRRRWLGPVATGKLMVAVAVTEPNIGSDVASVTLRATEATTDGAKGYVLNGAKAWCTFAGRADILALLARTESNASLGHKGLSLFIVEKDAFTGHEFEMLQSGGGVLTGKADATIGYRGMHSFTLQFKDYFVPEENLVGGEDGKGKGFYLQMDGFAAGRLQTGGRALGLAQAALEAAAQYTQERPQFGRPIAEFQNTQYELGAMAVRIEAARQLTYAAARAMDREDARASLLAAMAKLFACRTAVDVTQKAQLLHGGWGYAEEYPISRYVCDALVLPLFEGVEPILEMKVIGRGLLSGPR